MTDRNVDSVLDFAHQRRRETEQVARLNLVNRRAAVTEEAIREEVRHLESHSVAFLSRFRSRLA